MNNIETLATEKLIRKFDNQLLDLLSAELRSVKYSKTKTLSTEVIAA
ncbi:MAG: hypothetical protein ABI390_10790 [Daejeonella sp.]